MMGRSVYIWMGHVLMGLIGMVLLVHPLILFVHRVFMGQCMHVGHSLKNVSLPLFGMGTPVQHMHVLMGHI